MTVAQIIPVAPAPDVRPKTPGLERELREGFADVLKQAERAPNDAPPRAESQATATKPARKAEEAERSKKRETAAEREDNVASDAAPGASGEASDESRPVEVTAESEAPAAGDDRTDQQPDEQAEDGDGDVAILPALEAMFGQVVLSVEGAEEAAALSVVADEAGAEVPVVAGVPKAAEAAAKSEGPIATANVAATDVVLTPQTGEPGRQGPEQQPQQQAPGQSQLKTQTEGSAPVPAIGDGQPVLDEQVTEKPTQQDEQASEASISHKAPVVHARSAVKADNASAPPVQQQAAAQPEASAAVDDSALPTNAATPQAKAEPQAAPVASHALAASPAPVQAPVPQPAASTMGVGDAESWATASGNEQASPNGDALGEINAARVSRGLRNAVQQGGGAVTMRLTPAELGTVRVQMQLLGTTVSAQFHTENEGAHAMLSQQLTQLRSSLEGQGLTVDRLQVQMMPTGGHSQSSASHQQPQGESNAQQGGDGRSRGFMGHDGGQRGGQPERETQRDQREAFRRMLSSQVA